MLDLLDSHIKNQSISISCRTTILLRCTVTVRNLRNLNIISRIYELSKTVEICSDYVISYYIGIFRKRES